MSAPSYPCSPHDYKTVEQVNAKVLADATASDGCMTIELKSDLTILNCPGRGVTSPYSLVFGKIGTSNAKNYALIMIGYIKQ